MKYTIRKIWFTWVHFFYWSLEAWPRSPRGRRGGGHTSNANLLVNNSAKYGDNFLTVNLPIFKSLYMRHSSTVPHVKRRKCSSDNFILTNLRYENYLNVFVFVFFFLPFGWHWEALHNNIFPATSHRADIAKD